MKAIVYDRYGPPDVLQLKEVEKPVPNDNEVLIRVHATTVSAPDWRIRKADPWLARVSMGFFTPKQPILGYEFSGEIESIGKAVTCFKQGDKVFGENVGSGIIKFGAYAEFLCMPEDGLITIKPDNITYKEASVVPSGAMTALLCLRTVSIESEQKVLINGASGSIGTYAVQLAKKVGAEVTGVCSSNNLDLVKSLGADKVIDYTNDDFTQNGQTYDFIFDTVGKSSFLQCKNSLTQAGQYLSTGLGSFIENLSCMLWTAKFGEKKARLNIDTHGLEELHYLADLLAKGKLKPVIDRCYPLEETAEAHRYVEKGHKKGNVVIML